MRTYSFDVGDKTYTLKYTYNAICDAEEMAGKGLPLNRVPIGELLNNWGFSTMRLLICAGLQWRDHGMTVKRAGNIYSQYIEQGGNEEELNSEIIKLIVLALNPSKEEEIEEEMSRIEQEEKN